MDMIFWGLLGWALIAGAALAWLAVYVRWMVWPWLWRCHRRCRARARARQEA